MQLAQARPDEGRYLAPQERLDGDGQAEVLQAIVLVNVKVIVVIVRRRTVVVRLQIVVVCRIGHHRGQLQGQTRVNHMQLLSNVSSFKQSKVERASRL